MRRVTRHACEEGPVVEEQETEGQRRLHSLLLQQLDTDASIDRCVAKRKCFAPAAVYKPFGEQAAGVRSLGQFRALQDGERRLASLRELGLTDAEVELWLARDAADDPAEKGVCAAPGARQQRLQVIRDKMAARAEVLSLPQRFSASRPLTRREMEIERALFHGNDRLGFLSALYHQGASDQQGAPCPSDPLDSVYRDVLGEGGEQMTSSQDVGAGQSTPYGRHPIETPLGGVSDQSQSSQKHAGHSQDQGDRQPEPSGASGQSGSSQDAVDQSLAKDRAGHRRLAAPKRINLSQPIGSLCGVAKAGTGAPLTVRGEIADVTDEEIAENRESEQGIRNIPRFQNYKPGEPSKVLCVRNLSAQASVAQLVALFSRFEKEGGAPVLYRLLTGRLKGQAFITLSDKETAQRALELVNGYRLLGKPLVMEFGRQQRDEVKESREEEERKRRGSHPPLQDRNNAATAPPQTDGDAGPMKD